MVRDTLFRLSGAWVQGGSPWTANALLQVANPSHFSLTICPDGRPWSEIIVNDDFQFIFGLAPSDVDVTKEDIEERCNGSFFHFDLDEDDGLGLGPAPGEIRLCKVGESGISPVGFPLIVRSSALHSIPPATFKMTYQDDWLYFEFEGHQPVKAPSSCPSGDYRPCLSICGMHVRLKVDVDVHNRLHKHSSANDDSQAVKIVKALWEVRPFPDAFVVCGSRRIAVHRSVLATASPFFAAAFESQMREGLQAEVALEDAPDAVEILLSYLYTGHVGDEFDATAVLPVAHRLEINDLVEVSAAKMVQELCEENINKVIVALRPFMHDPTVKPYWDAVSHYVQCDNALVRKLMAAVYYPLPQHVDQRECKSKIRGTKR